MNAVERRGANVVSAAVIAIFALPVSFGIATSGLPEDLGWLVVMWAILAAPSFFASRILWHAWWSRTGARLSTMDAPARLLATAVATLPAGRRDWGAAMTAELAQVADRRARWWFAGGCARTAVFPPRGNRLPVLVAAVLAAGAVIVAAVAVGRAVPGMRLFSVTFVALVGAMVTLAVARTRRISRPSQGPTILAAGVVCVAACIALTGYMLVAHRSAVDALGGGYAVALAVFLAGSLWLTVAPPRALSTSRLARGVGLVAALVLGAGLLLDVRLDEHRGGVMGYLLLAPVVTFFLVSAVTAAVGRSFRAGVQAAVWTALVASLLIFAVWLVEAMRWYRIDGSLLLDGDGGHSIGTNLEDAVFWVLVFVPAWALPFGVIGAALGARAAAVTDRRGPTARTGPRQ